MTPAELLADAVGRIRETVHEVLDGASDELLAACATPATNTVGWLVWHLTRAQDDHVADAAGTGQVWTDDGWATRFGLDLDDAETGYGHTSAQVAAVRASAELLAGYHDAVADRTLAFLADLTGTDLDRVVDRRWDPPVTLGVRLVSIVADDLQHAGQAAFLRGLLADR